MQGTTEEWNREDEILLEKIRSGDTDAEEKLLKKYGEIVEREYRYQYLVIGAEPWDLIQEGMIGLVRAIREYRTGQGATFHTYAWNCIRNQIKSAIRVSKRKKNLPLNYYLPIDPGPEDSDGTDPAEHIRELWVKTTEEAVLRKEDISGRFRIMDEVLSSYEHKVADLFLDGYTCQEIAQTLGKTERSVENALARIRKKLKKAYQE